MVVVEQECCWVVLQFTIFRWTEDLCVQLEQHESQSKKSDYQGGQLAQANTNTKKIRKACLGQNTNKNKKVKKYGYLAQAGGHEQQGAVGTNYVKARPDSEFSFKLQNDFHQFQSLNIENV